MPPKNKQIIPEWNQCIHCSRILGYRDLSKHKDECLSNKSFSHGYVLHNIFNAVVCPLPEGKGGNIDLPIQMKKDLILMNPSAMQLCGFYIGGLCVLNKTHIRTCWPCSSVGLSSVAISDSPQGVRQGELVSLELFIDPLQQAVEVTLMSSECSPVFKDEMFLQFLSRCKESKYVCKGCKMVIQYYGQKFNFEVTNIIGQTLPSETFQLQGTRDDIDGGSLSESIANLSITNNDSFVSGSDRTSMDSSFGKSDSHSGVDITSTPCSNRKTSVKSKGSEGSSIIGSGLDTSVDKLTTPVKETDASTDNLFSPRTPVSERSFSAHENFCTPFCKVEKFIEKNISQNFYKVTSRTKFIIHSVDSNVMDRDTSEGKNAVRYADIGGMKKQIEMLKEMVHTPVEQPELFRSFGLPPPSGVLLFGPSGCGKSMLVKAVISEININIQTVAASEIWSK